MTIISVPGIGYPAAAAVLRTQNHSLMKNKKPGFDATFWAGRTGGCPLQLFDAFFQLDSLSEAKERLSSMTAYAAKRKVLSEKDP